jgi:hypothetical protein
MFARYNVLYEKVLDVVIIFIAFGRHFHLPHHLRLNLPISSEASLVRTHSCSAAFSSGGTPCALKNLSSFMSSPYFSLRHLEFIMFNPIYPEAPC